MQTLHSLRSAFSRPDRGARSKADADESHYSEPDGGVEDGVARGYGEGGTQDTKDSSKVRGSLLEPRPQSPLLSVNGSDPSDLPPSECTPLHAGKASKWNTFADRTTSFRKLRHSRPFWIIIGLIIMGLLTIILTTVLVLLHAHKTHANLDFTVDLGYSKYVGVSASDNKVVKWLGIRYAAPPTGDFRFKAPQAPVSDGKTVQADTVCSSSHFQRPLLTIAVRQYLPLHPFYWYRSWSVRRLSLPECLRSGR